jgi:hypothetical protein
MICDVVEHENTKEIAGQGRGKGELFVNSTEELAAAGVVVNAK